MDFYLGKPLHVPKHLFRKRSGTPQFRDRLAPRQEIVFSHRKNYINCLYLDKMHRFGNMKIQCAASCENSLFCRFALFDPVCIDRQKGNLRSRKIVKLSDLWAVTECKFNEHLNGRRIEAVGRKGWTWQIRRLEGSVELKLLVGLWLNSRFTFTN